MATLETHPEVAFRWRHRGSTPSPERLMGSLWEGALLVFVVEDTSGEPLGLIAAFGADLRAQNCSVGVVAWPDRPAGPNPVFDGLMLTLDYIFDVWPFRKVYAEAPGFAFDQYASIVPAIFEREGLLKGHDYYRGRWWDKHLLALSRERWEVLRDQWLPLVGAFSSPNGHRGDHDGI